MAIIGCRKGSREEDKIIKQRTDKMYEVLTKFNKKIVIKFPELKKIKSKKEVEKFLSHLQEIKIRYYFSEIKKILGRDIFGQGFIYRIISDNEIMDKVKLEIKI